MELKIAGYTLDKYQGCTVNLKYDSIASTFSFKVYYDPKDHIHKLIFRPGAYHRCEIWHGGVLLLTGTVLSPRFGVSSVRQWQDISGYSLPGVLEDSCVLSAEDDIIVNEDDQTATIPDATLEFNNITLEDFTGRLIRKYGIELKVDPELYKDANFKEPFTSISIKNVEAKVASVLDNYCRQKNVILSHTPKGELLLTRAKADKILTTSTSFVKARPVDGEGQAYVESVGSTGTDRAILYDFTNPGKDLNMSLSFNGQAMHRVVQVVNQNSGSSVADGACINPYVPTDSRGLRFRRESQTAGGQTDTLPTARMIVGDELKNIVLTTEVAGWTLGGNLITPNQMIAVTNPDLHLYKKSKWFIQEVSLVKDNIKETATITSVLPECYNNDKIVNVFL
jgi:prophage tail gpP-like protein